MTFWIGSSFVMQPPNSCLSSEERQLQCVPFLVELALRVDELTVLSVITFWFSMVNIQRQNKEATAQYIYR